MFFGCAPQCCQRAPRRAKSRVECSETSPMLAPTGPQRTNACPVPSFSRRQPSDPTSAGILDPNTFVQSLACFAMAAASTSAASAVATRVIAAAGAAAAVEEPLAGGDAAVRRKRARTPKIDIDALIAQHMANIKNAKKLESEAKKLVRNEKRKKQRLMKKASSLTPDDLERIAVLKRCGLWDPATGVRIMSASEREAVDEQLVAAAAAPPTTPTVATAKPLQSAGPERQSSDEEADGTK